jgi:L-alanine-DL-glutamate epimerase-like enolase superfamily enzyme
MKSILQNLINQNREQEKATSARMQAEIDNPETSNNRRSFLKKGALGGLTLTGLLGMSFEDTIARSTSKVSRFSSPSELKITDLRYCVISNGTGSSNARNAIIRIDTNQGIYGLGEVRDGGDVRYALFLKSRILGKNPCNVEMILKTIRQFGGHGRAGGGFSAVDMALWDLAGKAYNVPVYQLLGGKYRDTVRLYSYVPGSGEGPVAKMDMEKLKADMKHRMVEQGFTWMKCHPGLGVVRDIPGALVNNNKLVQNQGMSPRHPFTAIQYTPKGLDAIAEYVETLRNITGYDVPLSADHQGHFDVNTCIRVGNALEKYSLASLEDFLPWDDMEQLKMVTDAINTPTMSGEDIYLKEAFKKLCDDHVVDIMQPDMGSSGGILETKRIGDYAEEKGHAMALHFAGTPVCFMANVHCAAATQNVLALEVPNQIVDNPWWPTLVRTVSKQPLYTKGFANVPLEAPGLGIELNEDVMKQHLQKEDPSWFEPTPQWNEARSFDGLFT